jgi:hypothetical protein
MHPDQHSTDVSAAQQAYAGRSARDESDATASVIYPPGAAVDDTKLTAGDITAMLARGDIR